MAQLGQPKLKYQRPGLYWHALNQVEESDTGEEGGDGGAG